MRVKKLKRLKMRAKSNNLFIRSLRHCVLSAIMALFSLCVYVILAFLFAGCAAKTEYIETVKTVEVKVPVVCELPLPTLSLAKGIKESDNASAAQRKRLENEVNIYVFADELEATLKACKGKTK